MNKQEIQEAIKIIKEPITVNSIEYKYFTQENYEKLLRCYENCQWFINNWEQFEQNIEDLKKKAELGEHYKKLYSEVKKQKDDVVEYIKENKDKTIAPYGDNEDTDYEVCLFEEDINELLRMLGEKE